MAQAEFQADRHIAIAAAPLAAEVSYKQGNNYGHVWEDVKAEFGHETVLVHIDHDGGAFIHYSSSEDEAADGYRSDFVRAYGYVTIGKGIKAPSKVQKRVARFIAAMQAAGHFEGVIALVAPGHSYDLKQDHFARYARARGWPEKRYGEYEKAARWYYDAKRFGRA